MSMWWDLCLQAIVILTTTLLYLWTTNLPHTLLAKLHTYRHRNKHQARRHFVKAADLLSKARSHPRSSPLSLSLAAASATEADAAVKLDPSDAAIHIVLALALHLQGFTPSAIQALDTALSPLAVASLSVEEKADAVVRRAEMRVEVGGGDGEGVWSVVEREMREVVRIKGDCGKAWCLIGECCEKLGRREGGVKAFEEAFRVEPGLVRARQGLQRLKLDSNSPEKN